MSEHKEPKADMECMSCYDEIDESNYIEYQAEESLNIIFFFFSITIFSDHFYT